MGIVDVSVLHVLSTLKAAAASGHRAQALATTQGGRKEILQNTRLGLRIVFRFNKFNVNWKTPPLDPNAGFDSRSRTPGNPKPLSP